MKTSLSVLALAATSCARPATTAPEPTKANTDTVNKNPHVDQDARSKSTTGGDQPVTASESK